LGTFPESEADSQLRNLADNLPGGMVYQLLAIGDVRQFLYVSRGVREIFGISASEALADSGALYSRILPEFIPAMVAAEQQSMAKRIPFMVEVAVRASADELRWVRINSAPRIRADGTEVWDGVVLDISDQKKTDLAHRVAEKRLELATVAARIGIWDWDLTTGRLEYSARAKEIYGFPPDMEITYDLLRQHTVEDDFQHTSPALKRALDPDLRSSEVYKYRIRQFGAGDIRWVLAYGSATFGERDGKVQALSYVGTIQDVTDQHLAEQALREGEERLRLAIGAGKMAVWELDVKSGKFTPSPELNALYGFAPDAQTTPEDFRSRYALGERERVGAESAAAMARGEREVQLEAKYIWPDGTVKWLAIRANVERDAGGAPSRAIGIVMDITERREAEERLKVVARELQHRVKNSLAVVQTIATQTFRSQRNVQEMLPAFTGRLQALAETTDLLTHTDWTGAELTEVLERVTRPYRDGDTNVFTFAGPPTPLPSSIAIAISMGVHELCTNAVKYGALSTQNGRVTVDWNQDGQWLNLRWSESGGPPVPSDPVVGFGTRLLRRGLLEGPNGNVAIEFARDGVVCKIRARLTGA
jgi:PAS domain S-box-containing protein